MARQLQLVVLVWAGMMVSEQVVLQAVLQVAVWEERWLMWDVVLVRVHVQVEMWVETRVAVLVGN